MRLELGVEPDQLERPGGVTVSWTAEGATAVLLSGRRVDARRARARHGRRDDDDRADRVRRQPGRVGCGQKTVTVRGRARRGLIVPWWGDGASRPRAGRSATARRHARPARPLRARRGRGRRVTPADRRAWQARATLDVTGIGGPSTDPGGKHRHGMESPRTWRYDSRDTVPPRSSSTAGAAGAAWVDAGEHPHELELTLPAGPPPTRLDPRPLWQRPPLPDEAVTAPPFPPSMVPSASTASPPFATTDAPTQVRLRWSVLGAQARRPLSGQGSRYTPRRAASSCSRWGRGPPRPC